MDVGELWYRPLQLWRVATAAVAQQPAAAVILSTLEIAEQFPHIERLG